jgi:hypothetical protein
MDKHGTPVSDERFVLAFYGIDPSPRGSEGFFLNAVQWFSELGYPPDKLGVVGEGHGGRVGDYRRSKSRLEKMGFSRVNAFDIHASKPNAIVPGMEFLSRHLFPMLAMTAGMPSLLCHTH